MHEISSQSFALQASSVIALPVKFLLISLQKITVQYYKIVQYNRIVFKFYLTNLCFRDSVQSLVSLPCGKSQRSILMQICLQNELQELRILVMMRRSQLKVLSTSQIYVFNFSFHMNLRKIFRQIFDIFFFVEKGKFVILWFFKRIELTNEQFLQYFAQDYLVK